MIDTPDPYALGLDAAESRLMDYNPLWPRAFAEEAAQISAAVGPPALAIEHFGSTSVPGLRAKPIIDLLIGATEIDHALEMVPPMVSLGYDYAGSQGIPDHHIFGRGVARTHLAHVVLYGGDQWKAALAFRDRLRADAEVRSEYQALKERLAEETTSRAAYTAGKSVFVLAHCT